jgi:NAD(P)-dependent dehydrogenase (short-subunit alcohol dehydrogenase family)
VRFNNLFDLSSQVALVTGAASGLGRSISEVLVQAGATVALLDIDQENLAVAASALRETGANVITRVVDLRDRPAIRAAVTSVVAEYERLDIVFANAGIGGGPGFRDFAGQPNEEGDIEAISDACWDEVISVNLDAAFALIQAAAAQMKPRKSGRIIVTTSIASFRNQSWVGTPYMAAKAGAAHLVRQVALELAPFNITVNAIAPGAFATNIGGGRLKREDVRQAMGRRIPMGRVADPIEIRGLALFLASAASGFITGTEIPIDGGSSLVNG